MGAGIRLAHGRGYGWAGFKSTMWSKHQCCWGITNMTRDWNILAISCTPTCMLSSLPSSSRYTTIPNCQDDTVPGFSWSEPCAFKSHHYRYSHHVDTWINACQSYPTLRPVTSHDKRHRDQSKPQTGLFLHGGCLLHACCSDLEEHTTQSQTAGG